MSTTKSKHSSCLTVGTHAPSLMSRTMASASVCWFSQLRSAAGRVRSPCAGRNCDPIAAAQLPPLQQAPSWRRNCGAASSSSSSENWGGILLILLAGLIEENVLRFHPSRELIRVKDRRLCVQPVLVLEFKVRRRSANRKCGVRHAECTSPQAPAQHASLELRQRHGLSNDGCGRRC